MKQLILLLFISSELVALAEISAYEESISRVLSDPSPENVRELSGHLRGAARYNNPSESSPYYQRIKDLMISIPGHARYIADEIKRNQKEVEGIPTMVGKRISYDRNRGWDFLTMRHLPSPETILVLGEFLSDDVDTPVPLNTPGSDWGENPRANSHFAAQTIYNIGLREPPQVTQGLDLYPDDLLAATRTWWEQIRSGQRTFSFKGQGVEYRFKPDGTWDTIRIANPADDDPKVPEPSPSTIRVEKHLAPVSQAGYQEAGTLRYLFGSLAALLALAGAWFGLRRLKAHT